MLGDGRRALDTPAHISVRRWLAGRLEDGGHELYRVVAICHGHWLGAGDGNRHRVDTDRHRVGLDGPAAGVRTYGRQRISVDATRVIGRVDDGAGTRIVIRRRKRAGSTRPCDIGHHTGHSHREGDRLQRHATQLGWQSNRTAVVLLVVKNDFVIAVNQVVASVRQAVTGNDRCRRQLLLDVDAELVVQAQAHRRFRDAVTALFVVGGQRNQRNRRVADSHGGSARVRHTLGGAEQRHFVAVVLLIHELAGELRIHRQIGFGAHVPAVGRTLEVVGHISRLAPIRQTHIAIGRQLEVVRPGLGAEAQAGVLAGQVTVVEGVTADQPFIERAAVAGAQVDGIAVIVRVLVRAANANLREKQILFAIDDWQQQVEAASTHAVGAKTELQLGFGEQWNQKPT